MDRLIGFIIGLGCGMVAGAFLTKRVMEQRMNDEIDEEVNQAHEHYISKLKELEAEHKEHDKEVEAPAEQPSKEFSKASYTDHIKPTDEDSRVHYNDLTEIYKTKTGEMCNAVAISSVMFAEGKCSGTVSLYWFEGDNLLVDADESFIEPKYFEDAFKSIGDEEDDVGYAYWAETDYNYEIFRRKEEYAAGILDQITGEDDDV